ncbi:MAG: response regulator [bacterium]|nr:response regulator [bacterium]
MGEIYRALLVDDNLINREMAAAMLESYGFRVTEASGGAEAVKLAKQTRFHIIFMDHRMPGIDGVEAARMIRRECGGNGKAPVIVALTADAPGEQRDRFLQEGFQDILQKPLEREALEAALGRWSRESGREGEHDGESGAAGTDPGKSFGTLKEAEAAQTAGNTGEQMEDIHISGIEIAEAKKHHTGGAEAYAELLRLYCMDGRRKLELLVSLLKNRDYANYGVEVHGLKSASANIGAMEVSARAREQEEAAKRKDTAFIAGHSKAFLESYAGQLRQIERFLEERDKGAQKTLKGARLEREEILRRVREALEHLENFRSRESAKCIDDLLGHETESSVEEKLKEIKKLLAMYEDDDAEELLRELSKRLEKED